MPGNPVENLVRPALIGEVMQPFAQRQQTLSTVRAVSNEYFYNRGLLSLYEGDIASAKTRFEQSRQPGVPDWGVPEMTHARAEHYLKLILEAEKKAGK
jgi:hypothetical protein